MHENFLHDSIWKDGCKAFADSFNFGKFGHNGIVEHLARFCVFLGDAPKAGFFLGSSGIIRSGSGTSGEGRLEWYG